MGAASSARVTAPGSAPTARGPAASARTAFAPTPRPAALAAVGGIALVDISGSPFAIVRTSSTAFVALSRVCPHQGNIVNPNGSGFLCPGHGARFGANGTWTGGERTNSLRSYATTYDA